MANKTNKQLLNLGLAQYEILELLEKRIKEENLLENIALDMEDGLVILTGWSGDKRHEFTMYSGVEMDETINYETEKKGDGFKQWIGEIKSQYRNKKEFKSIDAAFNNLKRAIGA